MGRWRCSQAMLVLLAYLLNLAHTDDEKKMAKDRMPYYLDPRFENDFEIDDNKQALLRTRTRIAAGLNATYGVMMVATEHDLAFSAHTIPIWQAYCKKHGYDFFLQQESLLEGGSFRPHWTKPRLLMELIAQAKWKYIWMVDPQSLPVAFDKRWQVLVKEYLRMVRFRDDSQKSRVLWCPEDCEKIEGRLYEHGDCYGPRVSGCIFWVKPEYTLPPVFKWYQQRKEMKDDLRGLKLGLKSIRSGSYYDMIFFSPTKNEFGFSDSTFLATHDTRDEVLATIGRNKVFGELLNKQGEFKPEL